MSNFIAFWAAYPNRKGKGAAEKKYQKITQEEHTAILLAIDAQKRYRVAAKKTQEFVPDWCMPLTWLNQQRWLDEIPSHADLKEKAASKKCHCGEDFPCAKHFYDNLKDDWRWSLVNQEWRRLGKPKTQTECIESLRREGKLNLLLIIKRPPGKRGGDPTRMGDL